MNSLYKKIDEFTENIEIVNKMSVNGNNLYYFEYNSSQKSELESIGDNIFTKNPDIDSIIFLNVGKNSTDFLVYERNGEFSEICGNGIGGASKYIFDKYLYEEVSFITQAGKEVKSKIDIKNNSIKIDVGEKEGLSHIDDLVEVSNNLDNLSQNISYFLNNPISLEKIFNGNKDKTTYLLQIFKNLEEDSQFKQFITNLDIKDFSAIGGEPHLIIDIGKSNIDNFLIDYYLKAISFLLRYNISGNKTIKGDTNFMFVKVGDIIKMWPSERGVDNGIYLDQTGACGSGSMAVGTYLCDKLNLNSISIENRSGKKIGVTYCNNSTGMEIDLSNIQEISNNNDSNNPSFLSDAIYEEYLYKQNIKKNLNKGSNHQNFLEKNKEFIPHSSKKINEMYGNVIVSTCLHESEFPIDPYKITSSYNSVKLANLLGVTKIDDIYLDTTNGNLKSFPNIKTKNGKLFKNVTNLISSLEKLNIGKKGIRQVLLYIKAKSNYIVTDNFESIEDKEIKDLIIKIESLFNKMLGLDSGNIVNSEYGKYIIDIYNDLGIYDIFKDKLGVNNNTLNNLLITIIDIKIKKQLTKLYLFFVKELLRVDFSGMSKDQIEKHINKILQDGVVTLFINENLSKEIIDDFKSKEVLTPLGNFEKDLSSENIEFKEKIRNSLLEILNDDDFSNDFFESYFKNCINHSGRKEILIGEFNDTKNGFKRFKIYYGLNDETGNYGFFAGKGKDKFEVGGMEYIKKLLSKSENIVNIQGALNTMILFFGNVLTVGSERGYRKILIDTINDFYPCGKYKNFTDIIGVSRISGDFDPSKDKLDKQDKNHYNYEFPIGTDNSIFGDLFIEFIIGGGDFIKSKTKELLGENLSDKEVNEEEIVIFLKEIDKSLDIYDFESIYEEKKGFLISKGKHEVVEKLDETKGKILYQGDDIDKIIEKIHAKYLFLKK